MESSQAMSRDSTGTFYGLGVGPGDPELITVKAWHILSTVPVVAYLTADGRHSTARDIAKPFLPEDVQEIAIDMPMRTEREPAQAAYDEGARLITEQLKAGRDVAMLCEGDPFFYGSFMFLFARLADRFKTIVVPGVTSMTAAAARIGRPLAARNDVIKVLPATLGEANLRQELANASSAAIIKVGRHLSTVRAVLNDLGLSSQAVVIQNATRENELIMPLADVEGDSLPYFSTILVYAGGETW
jgi:precorrin-2/cobalt-factor-2 C20-methyltransferase